jgi:hypothetical protein
MQRLGYVIAMLYIVLHGDRSFRNKFLKTLPPRIIQNGLGVSNINNKRRRQNMPPSVKEILEGTVGQQPATEVKKENVVMSVVEASGTATQQAEWSISRHRSGKTLKDRITELADAKKRISFIVHTPGTEHERPFHSVQMKDFYIKETKDGNKLIVGRDLEKELIEDQTHGRTRVPGSKRKKAEKVFRSYRLDRILPRTLIACE